MNPKHPYSAVAVFCVVFLAFLSSICAQQAIPLRHVGDPEDWSTNQIVFTRDALARHPGLIDREPRIQHRLVQHWQPPRGRVVQQAITNLPIPSGLKRDWDIGTLGARLRENSFPAKYTFNPAAPPDCVNDYVVFGLSTAGVDGGQANLVAFNNLYVNDSSTGYCPGSTPLVMFAYNVTTSAGGKIDTSPVISLDGTEIAFVETVAGNPGSSIFHVLTWTAGQGVIGTAVTPTPAQMSTLLFSTTPNTTSSPWVDYSSDTAYIGDAKGNVSQITPVFNGTPALGASPWPVNVGTPYSLTSPVLDSVLDVLMVGSANGNIYQIPISNPTAIIPAAVGNGTSPQIVAPPIVDITNGTTFVAVSDNGTSAALEQFQTASLGLGPLAVAPIGVGASGGTKMHLFQPAFSNAYYNYVSGTNTGVVSLCGTGSPVENDTSPWQYEFGFSATLMNTTPVTGYPQQLSKDATDRCTGWTEFYNPNAGPTNNITAVSVASNVVTVSAINTLTVGEEVYIQDATPATFLNGQTLTVTSIVNPGPPNGGFTANFIYPAGYPETPNTGIVGIVDVITATLISSDILFVAANNANLTVGEQVIIQGTEESFLNNQFVTIASLVGPGPLHSGFTANFTAPSYFNPSDTGTVGPGTDFFFFGLTGDCTSVFGGAPNGCVVAIGNNNGTITTANAGVVGGPSGIVVDNYSSAAQASSIYFMSLSDDDAFKFTQNGLQ
ncbi:MAG: hypothetical protein ABSB87_07010 [Terriglobales bacterium]